ncbi:MAG: CocE/NonD family hydrolase [Bacteroidetes bacterium]|nr:CocE/NonD family hydrolase [Bacteroidota bacterium]
MKKLLIVLFIAVICSNITSAQQSTQNLSDSVYSIQDSVLIKTRDGFEICATIVQKKDNNKRLPVILFYTTYYQGPGDAIFGKQSADRDYVGIVAYSRGIRTDLNDYAPYEHDGDDVYDVIDWITKQTWSNGEVGMFGGSYTGFVQWAAAKNLHPALKTIVPQVAVMPGYDSPMENNIPYPAVLSWSNDNIYKYKRLPENLNDTWYEKGTSFRSMDTLAGQPNSIFQKWLSHPDYDSYWKNMIPNENEFAKINIPLLTTTGYYDGSQIGALKYFKLHYQYNNNANHYLVIGPYDHWGGQGKASADLMGYKIDSAANISMRKLAYQWLDYIFKGAEKPEILKDKINFEIMGANEWKHVPSLEKMNNDTLTFYLSDSKIGSNYLLSTENSKKNSFLEQTVNFKDRTTQNNYFTPFIINDSLDASNGLVFETEPFQKTFNITGSFFGSLKTIINKKDMDVSIAFYEVTPDFKYFYLTRYLGRASYTKDAGKRNLLQPGKKEVIDFDNTRLVCKQINIGSRLLIILNVNKHPYDVINYGSGKDVNDETMNDAGEPLQIKWFNDSYIKIPVWK